MIPYLPSSPGKQRTPASCPSEQLCMDVLFEKRHSERLRSRPVQLTLLTKYGKTPSPKSDAGLLQGIVRVMTFERKMSIGYI